MKESIALHAFGNNKWVGGIYYLRNIAFMLSTNKTISENYNIQVFTQPELMENFANLPSSIKIHCDKNRIVDKCFRMFKYKLLNVFAEYPAHRDLRIIGINPVNWIMDFQHKHLPQLFTEAEIAKRNTQYSEIANSKRGLVLSSNDSLRDFREYYSKNKEEVYVVPFVSFIEPMIRSLKEEDEIIVLNKHGLNGQYTCIMNQFWQHKNHKIVFDAMEKLYTVYPDCELTFVFTGKMEDYRDPEYIDSLKSIINKQSIAPHVKLLGFINREEQIAIMKNALFVIQPSLFEGWGTVVEDAKVLDKTILLSDIPVHKEQMNEKCILFDPYDPATLADLIYHEAQKEHHDDVEKGIADMYKRAKEYSKGFEQLLRDLEKE